MIRRNRQGDRRPELRRSTPTSRAARLLLPALFRTASEAARTWRESEDPEDLHDLRVAARRYRAAVRFFRPLLKHESVRRILKATERLAIVSGPLRDADVLASLGQSVRGDAAGGAPGSARLRRFLAGREFRALRAEVAGLHRAQHLEKSGRPTPTLGAFAAARLRDRLEDLTGSGLLKHLNQPNRVHGTRKRVRRLRYWAEMVAPSCGGPMAKLAARLHDAATALGELHDVDVALERRGADTGSLRRLRRERVRTVRSAWVALTGREGHLVIRNAMLAAVEREVL